MQESDRKEYREQYKQEKEKGEPFFPDALFKDAVTSLLVFLILVALAYFVGTPLEARADPGDATYTPRPEWYFLFLFQLLKYFPGNLEVIGVIVLPTVVVILLFVLPFIDRSSKRHFRSRLPIALGTIIAVVGIGLLTVQAVREASPPSEEVLGDPVAALYAANCATCHGASVTVSTGTDLRAVISQGRHEGMPAWAGDLTSDEIDSLEGFILSPSGSRLFNNNCSACHEPAELVASDPILLRNVLNEGPSFPAHSDLDIPDWSQTLAAGEATDLLNFLVAPDGRRLFTVNCASCHGSSVSFTGSDSELSEIISRGGLHLEMPPWRGMLTDSELETLAAFVVDPNSSDEGGTLFSQNCIECHGQLIPIADNIDEARQIIASGGSHETMPVWGDTLTSEQLDALVTYTFEAATGSPFDVGQGLFAQNCAACHGEFGEGGINPARSGDVIAPISSAEYLETRDDSTLRAIVSAGQPNFGMSPFGSSFGGPLDDDQIDAIVGFMRSWEDNPPVEFPPEVASDSPTVSGAEIYLEVCAQCHGPVGEGRIGPALNDPQFQERNSDQQLFDTINLGHEATAMIGWGEILTAEQIQQLVFFIRELDGSGDQAGPPEEVSYAGDIVPIFAQECGACHGTLGGWDSSSYQDVIESGDNGPAVIPGDVEGSLLAQKIIGTHEQGTIMPPAGKMSDSQIDLILDWIAAGAPQN